MEKNSIPLNKISALSWNVNGIRSAHKKGFGTWLENCGAEIVFLQEVRATEKDIPPELIDCFGYRSYWHEAVKKGYSGVGVYCKLPRSEIDINLGLGLPEFDSEGRVITVLWQPKAPLGKLQTTEKIAFVGAYFPNSQALGVRLGYKISFCEAFQKHLQKLEKNGFKVLASGDLNVAHEPIDLSNPKQNEKNAGYLPEERSWFSGLLNCGYVDTFRMFEKSGGHYSWWSNRPGVREKNIGWRIDYFVACSKLKDNITSAKIYKNVFGSDHCPVGVEISF